MTSFKKHLKTKYLVLFLPLVVVFCSEEEKKTKSIVQINDAVLTEEEVSKALSAAQNNSFKEEYINNWIRTEIMYSEAVKEGILDEKEFNTIIEQSKKELAISLYIKKLLDENKTVAANEELQKYYEEQSDDFKLADDAFVYNICEFDDFDKAVQFRSILLESDWNKAVNAFREDASLKRYTNNQLQLGYLLQPQIIYNAITNLQPGEVSIVMQTGESNFTVLQLINKYNKDEVPPFEAVKEKLRAQYSVLKQKEFIQNYIDKLVEENNVEIKRY